MSLKKTLSIAMALAAIAAMASAADNCCTGGKGTCPMGAGKGCSMMGGGTASAATLDASRTAEPAYAKLPGFDKKVQLGEYYFTYRFVKRPQIGTIILRVQVFDKNNHQVEPYEITGEFGMPSMKGAHDSGPTAFKLNKKGDYLLPVSVVMRGQWEVKLVIADKDKKPVYLGVFKFSV